MPQFLYKALDETGKNLTGVMTEPDRQEVIKKVSARGYFVLDVSEVKARRQLSSRSVTPEAVIYFTRKLKTMIGAGVPIITCTTLLWEQTEEKDLQIIISEIATRIGQGEAFSSALRAYPDVFSDIYVHLVEVGEKGGNFVAALGKAIEHLERNRDIRAKVQKAMTYPMLVLGAALLVFVAMFIFIIPIFKNVFAKMRLELPPLTKAMITISDFFIHFWWAFIIVGGVAWFVQRHLMATYAGRLMFDRARLGLPVVGKLVLAFVLSRFIRTFEVLFSAGVSISETLEGAKNSCGNEYVQQKVAQAMESVSKGKSISVALTETRIFPPFVCQMLAIGEKSGALADMLRVLGDSIDEEVDYQITRLTTLLGPLAIGVVGVLVALILLAIYSPISAMWGGLGEMKR